MRYLTSKNLPKLEFSGPNLNIKLSETHHGSRFKKKILFLLPYPLKESPSQRFRFEQYFGILSEKGYTYTAQTFLDSHNWQLFFKPGRILPKILALFKGFMRRTLALPKSLSYDFVFIHREATPVGPPVIEWLLAKVFRRRIIYDFDDAIWLTDRKDESFFLRTAKWRSKVGSICAWSYKVSCGNEYLCDYASIFNQRVVYNPTTIDTEGWHNPERFVTPSHTPFVNIGWTGSHSTLKYLKEVEPVLNKLQLEHPNVRFIVIADRKPDLSLPRIKFVPWNEATEVDDLMDIDIGIMPLPDDEWAKGKCGFKALQYMALKIPAVIAPVGVNKNIVDNGINGFLASSPEEWYRALETLINDENLRKKMGALGRRTVVDRYSVISNTSSFLSLFG
jgi:glycosyltransferase involved in cell wall biosynthesis